jgi:S-DNA-T family DNA segregation ATPase FtsK/SpoIIIE
MARQQKVNPCISIMEQTPIKTRPGLGQEAVAVCGIFLACYLLISLLPLSLSIGVNWGGELGRILAGSLLEFIGVGAYLLVGLLLFCSFLFFGPAMTFNRLPQITAGLTGAVIAACGLLSSLSLQGIASAELGGFIGKTVLGWLCVVIAGPGAVLFLLFLLIISLMLSTRLSPYGLGSFFWRWLQKMRGRVEKRSNVRRSANAIILEKELVAARKEGGTVESTPLIALAVPVVKELPAPAEMSANDETFALRPVAPGPWTLPPLSLLDKPEIAQHRVDHEEYYKISKQLEQKLVNFGVTGKVVGISPGPVVTTYEYAPAAGIKISKIVALANDLALGLKAQSVRVVGSVPGKAALGIEIPNKDRQVVYIRDLLTTEKYRLSPAKLTIALGLDVVGNPVIADLARMPHLLIAGATGAGKSVAINTIISSLLYNATPDEVRLLMVDPKRIELSGYEGIPHLLHPVVVDPKLASRALQWAVREMERRYRLLEEAKVKSFDSYNEAGEEKLPYIVIIVDELADLMMVASKDVEASIARLAQMARAAGMHLILATQRPSVDVLTGLIKANFPTRISFKVASKIDSRTILDSSGAEHLLGAGDMLYLPSGRALQRVHGAYISEAETAQIVDFLKKQGSASYDDSVVAEVEEAGEGAVKGDEDADERYDEAVTIVCESGQASISMIQRRLRIGYNRAARLIEMMEKEGIVGPADGARPREVLVRKSY